MNNASQFCAFRPRMQSYEYLAGIILKPGTYGNRSTQVRKKPGWPVLGAQVGSCGTVIRDQNLLTHQWPTQLDQISLIFVFSD